MALLLIHYCVWLPSESFVFLRLFSFMVGRYVCMISFHHFIRTTVGIDAAAATNAPGVHAQDHGSSTRTRRYHVLIVPSPIVSIARAGP